MSAVRRALDLFAEWKARPDASVELDKFYKLCGTNILSKDDPEYKNLNLVSIALHMADQFADAVATPPADPELTEIKLSLRYIDTIIPALPDASKADAIQKVTEARALITPDADALPDAKKKALHQG